MGKRRAARELALKFLYQTEFNPDDREAQMEQFCERADTHHEITEFMKVLVDKVFSQSEEVAMVDRNILRLGICELLFETSTPPKVVINEAVEIAKKFGSEDSPDFINGILDKVFKETLKDASPPTVK